MVNRREWLGSVVGAGAALGFSPALLRALETIQQGRVLTRAIPSSGEMLPVIGLGSSATFSQLAGRAETDALKEVLKTLVDRGGKVFDTAPSYGASEQVAGTVAAEAGITSRIFWATKVNAAGGGGGRRGGGGAAPDLATAAKAQIESSFQKFKVQKMDAIQVHNLAQIPVQLEVVKQLKKEGRVRYIGTTSTSDGQYAALAEIMRNEPLDFIGIDYAADNRNAEEVILPLAIERKIGVMAYVPFGRTSLLRRAANTPLPALAKDIDAATWPQFFLKFVVSHPAITVVTPATSKPEHMIDNLAGGIGRLPNAEQRKQMIAIVDALPPAGRGV
jgi:aryl-alcohol dehydrogenase-like predicted oxidoreductase